LAESFFDKHCIEIFQIGQTDQLADIGIITDIPLFFGIFFPPLFGGLAEQRHVQNISFRGVNLAGLLFVQGARDQVFSDGIGVNAVVDFGKIATNIPTKLFLFLFFKALKLFDEIELELR